MQKRETYGKSQNGRNRGKRKREKAGKMGGETKGKAELKTLRGRHRAGKV
jgi:hypothetical protein